VNKLFDVTLGNVQCGVDMLGSWTVCDQLQDDLVI